MAFSIGDKVRCSASYTYGNTQSLNKQHMSSNVFEVMYIGGYGYPDDRIVIGIGGVITAAVDVNTLTLVNTQSTTTPVSEYVAPASTDTSSGVNNSNDTTLTAQGIEDILSSLYYNNSVTDGEYLKYNMRLFGLPHQHTRYTDNRAYSPSYGLDTKDFKYVGRKFIENIMIEAPVITVIPGKPLYLPGAKDKRSITHSLLTAASGNLGAITQVAGEQQLTDKLRYYDFQQDYYTYMKYVNILCSTSAALLELDGYEMDGTKLTLYDWKNYRWNGDKYELASVNIANAAVDTVSTIASYTGEAITSALSGDFSGVTDVASRFFQDVADTDILASLESLLTQSNFVQFYVDPSSGVSESSDNTTATSGLEGTISGFEGMAKDFAFIMGSAGLDTDLLKQLGTQMDGYTDAATAYISNSGVPLMSDVGGLLDRLGGAMTNVIKGENMIFPEIYQNSKFTKNYSMTVNLKMPYGNRLSYFLNILVPLYHLLALAIPKQTTANSYGAPFIIKAYYPGVFSCNLGLVSSINIEKCPTNSDGWTIDGLPTEMRVTLNIIDLYSDLAMTPAGDISLFLSNSSLIEYISTKCGVSMITPKLEERATLFINTLEQGFSILGEEVGQAILGPVENFIAYWVGV